MRIAILMSTYNGEFYLKEQIESILKLDKSVEGLAGGNNPSFEFEIDLWVRDDGSTDSTIIILNEYMKNGLLNWYGGANVGAARSFIDLIRHCPGYDYYAFADQDDCWMHDKLSSAIKLLENEKKDIPLLYASNAILVDDTLATLGLAYPFRPKTDYKLVSCSCGLLGCTMMFNSKLASYIQTHRIPEKMIMHDYYLTLLCGVLNGIIVYDDFAHIQYRQHGNNVCGISYGIVKKIQIHIQALKNKPSVSIADQAEELVDMYGEILDLEKKYWLLKVKNYKISFFSRISLALSCQYHFYSIRRAIPMRLRILLGNM